MQEQELLLPVTDSQQETLDEVVKRYSVALTQDVGAVRYLRSRGLNREIVDGNRLGIVREPEHGHGHLEGWLAIPYLDKKGMPLGIRFRCLRDHDHGVHGGSKYFGLPGEPTRVYNARAIVKAKNEVNVAEGELDCMTLTMIGLDAVGIPGVHNWKPHHKRMLAGFGIIHIWADPDTAGLEFARRVQSDLRHARVVPLQGGDVSETYVKHGAEHLLSLLERGK